MTVWPLPGRGGCPRLQLGQAQEIDLCLPPLRQAALLVTPQQGQARPAEACLTTVAHLLRFFLTRQEQCSAPAYNAYRHSCEIDAARVGFSADWCQKYIPQIAQGVYQWQHCVQAVWHSCLLRCTDDHLTLTYGGRSAEQLIPSWICFAFQSKHYSIAYIAQSQNWCSSQQAVFLMPAWDQAELRRKHVGLQAHQKLGRRVGGHRAGR